MGFIGHWHGYGPWIGSNAQYNTEYLRRPTPLDPGWIKTLRAPDPQAFSPFERRSVPPMQTGHHLLRKPPDLASRTWQDPSPAVDWLIRIYQQYPPIQRRDGGAVDCGPAAKASQARTDLGHGTDVVWCYYVPGDRMINFAVVACPSRHLPDIPCPQG
ncbi:hypothetical protein [Kitasatospora purpeofusca]|uniref:Uncharacterized protein n=1 Tax=Kitasatospora purpeofusca TaxID=67352 RepID=A0ABZ1TX87_9ACTN|nr:hypothetical protein [Kitasatospora purpeofusca]